MRKIIVLFFIISGCTQSIANNVSSERCSLKPETGNCRAAIRKYYFDKPLGFCRTFIWGGCGGVVPFDTLNDCKSVCTSDVNSENLEKLKQSISIWKDSQNQNENSYQYSTGFNSWTGFGNKTTINVMKGDIVSREYHSWDRERNNITQWTEDTPEKLGTNKEGAPIKVIEELYDDCREILSTKNEANNHIFLAFDKNGLMTQCQYSPKGCADDCASGVRIIEFSFY